VVVEAWEYSPDFHFGVAGDGHLSEVLERIRKGKNLPALAAESMTSTGVIEPGSRSQSGHKSSRFTSEKATKLDSKLDYNPSFRFQSTRRNPL
jgi:hypothetical protein